MARLESQDLTYWFVKRAFDWSVVLQVTWLFDRPVAEQALNRMNDHLAAGTLNRRAVPSRVPVARPRWVHSPDVPPIVLDTVAVAKDAVAGWAADELRGAPLDAVAGRAWQLRAAPIAGGGHVVSLTALHLVADGRGMVEAAACAAGAGTIDPLPVSTGTAVASLLSDVADVATVVRSAGVGIVRAVGEGVRAARRPSGDEALVRRGVRSPMHMRSPGAQTRWVVVTVSAQDWVTAAERHQGTANTLFVAVITGALRRAGHLAAGEPIKVGIPVSRRTEGDDRANATAGVSVELTGGDVEPGGDLGALRHLCKQAYQRLSDGERTPLVHLTPLMQLLPTSVVATVATSGNGMPDAMTSNLGAFAQEYGDIGGVRASAVAFRGDAQGVDPGRPERFGDGLQAWSLQVGDAMSISIAGFDESAFGDEVELAAMVSAELDCWGVLHRIW